MSSGPMLLYATLGTNNVGTARKFYETVLPKLGYKLQYSSDEEIGYSAEDDTRCRLYVVTPFDKQRATNGNGSMIAFSAKSRRDVDVFYAAALAAGGVDEGKPGLRPYHDNFYAAYVRDLDGNKLCAVCEIEE